jgi:ABC-2 type transport system ATP-binding protein
MSILSVEGLSKSYGKVQALRQVSFSVPPGSVFGILGPNGSGKTTLLGTVLEVLFPSAGRFTWFDQPVGSLASLRRRIGTLLETPNYYPYLTGAQNLAVTAAIRGRGEADIPRVLEQVGLAQASHLSFSQYSLGMKQRLALGGALLGDPEVLVLDEPTNGLDPAGIADVRTIINDLRGQGKTIILASHLLDQVEKVCTHVAILKKGTLLESGSMSEVLSDDTSIDVEAPDLAALETALRAYDPVLALVPREGGGFRVSGRVSAEELNRHCFARGVALSLLHTRKRDLESRFLEITDE